jgi:hypothetical protein
VSFALLWAACGIVVAAILLFVDGYTRYLGYPGKTDWPRMLISSGVIGFIVAVIVFGIVAVFK